MRFDKWYELFWTWNTNGLYKHVLQWSYRSSTFLSFERKPVKQKSRTLEIGSYKPVKCRKIPVN